jgi:hypothetical protein
MVDWTKDQLVKLYHEEGKSLRDIAYIYETDQWTVGRAFDRFEITRRKPGGQKKPKKLKERKPIGGPKGERHGHWKGDKAGYRSFHNRLDGLFGRPKYCEKCGTKDPTKRYDWANESGKYEDPYDYLRLCSRCHKRWDTERSKEP